MTVARRKALAAEFNDTFDCLISLSFHFADFFLILRLFCTSSPDLSAGLGCCIASKPGNTSKLLENNRKTVDAGDLATNAEDFVSEAEDATSGDDDKDDEEGEPPSAEEEGYFQEILDLVEGDDDEIDEEEEPLSEVDISGVDIEILVNESTSQSFQNARELVSRGAKTGAKKGPVVWDQFFDKAAGDTKLRYPERQKYEIAGWKLADSIIAEAWGKFLKKMQAEYPSIVEEYLVAPSGSLDDTLIAL